MENRRRDGRCLVGQVAQHVLLGGNLVDDDQRVFDALIAADGAAVAEGEGPVLRAG